MEWISIYLNLYSLAFVTTLIALIFLVLSLGEENQRLFGAIGGGLLLVGVLSITATFIDPATFDGLRASSLSQRTAETVSVTFTSDPEGAQLRINGQEVGETPVTTQVKAGETIRYSLQAEEPYEEYNLFKPYSGTFEATQEEAVSVWLDRTSPEEQADQREQYAEEQRRAEQRRIREVVRASPWNLRRRTDEITDADRSYISTDAIRYPRYSDDAYLMIRCDSRSSDGIDLLIESDDYLNSGDDVPVDWRFGSGNAVQGQPWRPSTDGTAAFNTSYKTQFLRSMRDQSLLTARLYDYRRNRLTYEFRVSDVEEAIELLGCYRGSAFN